MALHVTRTIDVTAAIKLTPGALHTSGCCLQVHAKCLAGACSMLALNCSSTYVPTYDTSCCSRPCLGPLYITDEHAWQHARRNGAMQLCQQLLRARCTWMPGDALTNRLSSDER